MFHVPFSIEELVEKVDFHDSIITNVEYDHDSLCTIVSLEFCNWRHERFVVVGGCGIVIYHIRQPFDKYLKNQQNSEQWTEIELFHI